MGYVCDQHPDTPAVLLITNLGDGDTVTLGAECVGAWAASLAEAFAAMPPVEADPDTDTEADPVEVEADPVEAEADPVEAEADQVAEDNAVYEADRGAEVRAIRMR